MILHPFIETLVNQGIPPTTIVLLLFFPIIATFVVILRQVVGLQAFGIYTPSIITFAFLFIGSKQVSDIKYAIAIYIIVLSIGMLMRYVLRKLRLLYLPRVAITLTVVSLSIIALLALASQFHDPENPGLAAISVFPILVIITLVEKFVAVQVEKGTRTAVILALETLVIALLGYFMMSEQTSVGNHVTRFIVAYPYCILLVIPFHIFLGKWTGLRLTEYYRFRDVLKKLR